MLFTSKIPDGSEIKVEFTLDKDYVFIKFGDANEIILNRIDAERLGFHLETLFLAEGFDQYAESQERD